MSIYTKEQFEEYKGNKKLLVVKYYPKEGGDFKVGFHGTYNEYVEFFNKFYEQGQDDVTIPRELLLYLQERVDPQNEYSLWMSINKYLEEGRK